MKSAAGRYRDGAKWNEAAGVSRARHCECSSPEISIGQKLSYMRPPRPRVSSTDPDARKRDRWGRRPCSVYVGGVDVEGELVQAGVATWRIDE